MHAKQDSYIKHVDYVQAILKLGGCLKFNMRMYIKNWLTFAKNLNPTLCVN